MQFSFQIGLYCIRKRSRPILLPAYSKKIVFSLSWLTFSGQKLLKHCVFIEFQFLSRKSKQKLNENMIFLNASKEKLVFSYFHSYCKQTVMMGGTHICVYIYIYIFIYLLLCICLYVFVFSYL